MVKLVQKNTQKENY